MILAPIAVSIAAQIGPVRDRIGARWAAALTPTFALSVVAIAVLLRSLVLAWGGNPAPHEQGRLARRFGTPRWMVRITWIATTLAGVCLIAAWFGSSTLAASATAAAVAVLLAPVWWLSYRLFDEIDRRVYGFGPVRAFRRYFLGPDPDEGFEHDEAVPPRWPYAIAFALVTAALGGVALLQFDELLRGMHRLGEPITGITSLAGTFDFDLSGRQEAISEAVAAWRQYSFDLGDAFVSARVVVAVHALIDSLVYVPSYALVVAILLMWARRRLSEPAMADEPEKLWKDPRRTPEQIRRGYEMLCLGGLVLLAVVAAADLVENFLQWYVTERAWFGRSVTDAAATGLWLGSFLKWAGMGVLALIGLVVIALWPRGRGRGHALVSLRAELVVIAVLLFSFNILPQTSDVVRRWTVLQAALTVTFAFLLGMLLERFARGSLEFQHEAFARREAGLLSEPARLRVPRLTEPGPTLLHAVAGGIVIAALVQTGLDLAGLPVGRGLLVPAAMVVAIWFVGLPLPHAGFERGDRPPPPGADRVLPPLAGALALFITGMLVWSSSLTHLLYARHESWVLLAGLVPPAIGLWRLHRRSQRRLGFGEVALVGVAVVAAVALSAGGNPQLSPNGITLVGLYLTYASVAFFHAFGPEARTARFVAGIRVRGVRVRPAVLAGLVIGTVVVGFLVADPVTHGPVVGTTAILLLFATFLTLGAAGAVRFAERTPPPRILTAFRVKRTPMFVLFVLWAVFASGVVPAGTGNIEVVEAAGHQVKDIGIEDAWDRWLQRNGLEENGAAGDAPGRRQAVPFVFISSSGGGIRSAVWTSLVLDCVFEATATSTPDQAAACLGRTGTGDFTASNRIGALSGVSGGSLGFVAYTAYLSAKDTSPAIAQNDGWVERHLGDDYLAASMARMVFVDLPRELLGFGTGLADRGEIMEESWERSWEFTFPDGTTASLLRRGLFELWHDDEHSPLMVLNGTSSVDGCRFNTSVLDAGVTPGTDCKSLEPFTAAHTPAGTWAFPATRDLADFLCDGQDIALSTAALLSSRFPFLAPSGRVATSVVNEIRCGEEGTAYVVDGGYLEGSGSRTLFELWAAFEPYIAGYNERSTTCIVPVMIHIDNGYESRGTAIGVAGPSEFAVPLRAAASAKTGTDANARASAALAFDQPLRVGGDELQVVVAGADGTAVPVLSRYARITTRAHPGVQAPLGWTLSDAAIVDLRSQLSIEENLRELAEIRSWFSSDLMCEG